MGIESLPIYLHIVFLFLLIWMQTCEEQMFGIGVYFLDESLNIPTHGSAFSQTSSFSHLRRRCYEATAPMNLDAAIF